MATSATRSAIVVTASNSAGSGSAQSSQTGSVSPPPAPGNSAAPAISGTAQQGKTLTTTNGSWTGSPTSYGYQWQYCDTSGANCTNITGATGSSYTLTANDVGNTIRAVVTASNAGGSSPAQSATTATVTAPPPPAAPTQHRGAGDQRHRSTGQDADHHQWLVDRQPDHVRLPVAGLRHLRRQLHQHQRRDRLPATR